MDYRYKIFNPATSKVANELISMDNQSLIKRYIKKKSNTPTKFFDSVREVVNQVDEEEFLVNPFLWDMEGSNLNYVASQVFIIASKLKQLGYEFKIDVVMRDLDRLFSEHASEVDEMTKESPVKPISKDVSYFFVTEVLTNKVFKTLDHNSTNSKGLNY